MKILMLITGMTSGGAERVMATLCNELSSTNEVYLGIYKESKTDYYINDRVKIISGNIKNKNIFKSVVFAKKTYKMVNPDVVLSFMTKTNITALIAKKLCKNTCPFIISERANPYNTKGILNFLRRVTYPSADGCVFQTEWAQEYYKNILKCKSIVIRNPLSRDFNVKPYQGVRSKRIVCTARLAPEKNQQFLINTFYEIMDKYPDYNLEIYGEGPKRDDLQSLIDKLGANNRIKLMGRRKDIIDCIKDAGVFVLPSRAEGMPNSLLEAMALGIPSISTDSPIGGSAFIINNNENAILIPMDDKDALKDAIDRIITDSVFAEKISKNGTKVIQDFETEKVCKDWENYLSDIAKGA